MIRTLRMFLYFVLLGTFILSVSSCDKDDDPVNSGFGTITGVVTDENGQPIPDVTVTVSGVKEADIAVTTGADGRYTAENVSLKLHAVTFSKPEWLTISKSVRPEDFTTEKVATVNASLVTAIAKITGIITDAKGGGGPLSDVTVTVGVAGTVKSGADGAYTIENLVVDNYTVTFSKTNYVSITRQVTPADFVNDVVTLNVTMGANELLRGLTADNLKTADKWYYNEYRGGRNSDGGVHWDWSVDYMSTLDFRGAWEEQNEGTTLQIRNNEGSDRSNPADLNVFDSFVFGSKAITADNKIMSLRVRTHSASASSPAYWGVQVVDLSAPEPIAVKIGDNKTLASENYTDFEFDLSAYVGKEIIIAIGTYRQATGDYWKQLVLRAIRFADRKVSNTDWLPGTEVVAGWKLTTETVRSTMVHTKKSFTGISPVGGNRDNYVDGYRSWRGISHIAKEWTLVPVSKDTEPFAGEGYLIKTQSSTPVNTTIPQAYLYAKFAIAAGSNQLTFRARNFGSNYTYFKLSAIEDNGTVTHVQPQSNTAQDASAAADGCWRFKHGSGDRNNPNDYASFVYDLSQFNGKNVTLVLGVYKGGADTDENKLVFYSVDLN
ncbi:carboxypeptidase-like regulatory domain-containing protein [Chryseosolibacter indicus]|uniref:Carboxypeptidase regulatory-like domain-containing protein n=1 Tax=Chryseosolibacter indicus TaxID=2782351 RepID=A0ABS5VWB3_9BACT|nr:carboxypeptidase-like regulatory domain-containing protein [Chryseosolibacter indicus]MBT1705621.1 carboxypeptidase regulatory-like domain-containing protein [Chryseosolibacter indicus]